MKNLSILRKHLLILSFALLVFGFYSCNPLLKMQKNIDQLKLADLCLYQQGKWATKIERIEVKITSSTLYATKINNHQEIEIRFETSKPINKIFIDINEHLTEQLTKYLNEIPN